MLYYWITLFYIKTETGAHVEKLKVVLLVLPARRAMTKQAKFGDWLFEKWCKVKENIITILAIHIVNANSY